MTPPRLTIILLTFNSQDSLPAVLAACARIASRILVVDSFSADKTLAVAQAAGCETVQHPFENYAAQRNWAQEHAGLAADDWVLHLDADEVMSDELCKSILAAIAAPTADGYLMKRLLYFLGQPIRYGLINPNWHLRLYRAGKGRCEDRLYDQHFVLTGESAKLTGLMHDLQLVSVERWTTGHNRWSTAEATEILSHSTSPTGATLDASLTGDLRMRKRWMKNNVYYQLPMFLRALMLFSYSYVVRLGFLDGRVGLVFHVLHSFWFRFIIDAKILEQQLQARATQGAPPAVSVSSPSKAPT